MDTYTGMAVDAFRKQEQARRRLAKAESAASAAARLIPKDQFNIWFVWTEIVRIEEDQKTAQQENDRESYEWCAAKLVELRADLARHEAALAASKRAEVIK